MCAMNDQAVVDRLLAIMPAEQSIPILLEKYKNKARAFHSFSIDKKHFNVFVHRLIYVLHSGKAIRPGMFIDHIDNNPSNNHPSNLREATPLENSYNCQNSFRQRKSNKIRNVFEKHSCKKHWDRETRTFKPEWSLYQARVKADGKLWVCDWTNRKELASMEAKKLRMEHHGVYAYDYGE